jgi:hypothetical protein
LAFLGGFATDLLVLLPVFFLLLRKLGALGCEFAFEFFELGFLLFFS